MLDEFLGPLFDDLGLHGGGGSEGSHDAELETAATSEGSAEEELYSSRVSLCKYECVYYFFLYKKKYFIYKSYIFF